MSHISKCIYCEYGLTDDHGSFCGVQAEKDNLKTHPLLLRAIASTCREAEQKYQVRKAEGLL